MRITRRRFVGSLATTLSAPALVAATSAKPRMPIAFSTLGCPRWDWKKILANAAEWQYAAIELRGLQGEMDLTKLSEFQGDKISGVKKDLSALGLKVSDLGASTRLHEAEPATRAKQLDEGRRFIDLAHSLSVPYVRVFGDRVLPDQPKQASIDRVVAGLQELGDYARQGGVTVLIESHGDFCDSPTLLQILKGAASPAVGLLWDTHHTIVTGKEDPAFTASQLRTFIHHAHLKDSKPASNEVRYVLTGTGTLPLRAVVRALAAQKYPGYYSFEWEKAWHPEIEEPEVAFPHYAKVMGAYLREAGVKPV